MARYRWEAGTGAFSRGTLAGLGVLLVLGGILLASLESRLPGSDAARGAVEGGLLPLTQAASDAASEGTHVFSAWNDARRLQLENEELQAELASLQNALAAARQRADELELMIGETDRLPEFVAQSIPVRVLGRVPDPARHALWIEGGLNRGIRAGQAVIAAGGLAGIVEHANGDYAIVRLSSDEKSRWGALAGEHRGIVSGTGRAGELEFRPETTDAAMEVGSLITTTGRVGSFAPASLPIGRVVRIDVDKSGERRAVLETGATTDLEIVFVFQSEQIPFSPPLSLMAGN